MSVLAEVQAVPVEVFTQGLVDGITVALGLFASVVGVLFIRRQIGTAGA